MVGTFPACLSGVPVIVSLPKWYRMMAVVWCTAFSGLSAAPPEATESIALPAIEEALRQAGDTIRRAQNPADLDSVLENLRLLREDGARPSAPEMSPVYRKVDAALKFVARWQDYLSVANSGDPEKAHDILESLSQTDQTGLIPRSEILARMHRPAAPHARPKPALKELLDRIKTLDDISAALETLNTWSREDRGLPGEIQLAITTLALLDRTYREFKAGLSTDVEGFLTETRSCANYLMPLRAQLLVLILPRYLGLSEDWKAKSDEGVHAFLDRIVADAITKRNHVLAARARAIQYSLKYGGQREMQGTQAAVFIAAHNQEEARQYALAVASYQKALAMGTDLVPPKVIGERLAAILKEHPAEYQEGMQQFLAPPSQRSFNPRRPPLHPRSNPRVLSVPAVSAGPTTTPSE